MTPSTGSSNHIHSKVADDNDTDQDDLILPVVKSKRNGRDRLRNGTQKIEMNKNDDTKEKKALYKQNIEEAQAKKEQLLNSVDHLHSPKASKAQLPGSLDISRLSISNSFTTLPTTSTSLPTSKLTKEQMSKTFDEWMKIAADNKITAKNSWQVALIDYFSDMSLLKDTDGLSINFQKASCTLDGCVKVYTNRVDSVADETGKLLHGLVDGKSYSDQVVGPSNEDDSEQDVVETKKKPSHKKKFLDPSDTLAKTLESINVSHFDLEFSVDPLFKKTCADFDECGSKGLLLNNIMIDSDGLLSMISGDKDDTTIKTLQMSSLPRDPFLPFISSIINPNNHISPSFYDINLRTLQRENMHPPSENNLTHSVQLVLDKLDKLRIQESEHEEQHNGWSDDDIEQDIPTMNLAERIHASVIQEKKEPIPMSTNQIIDPPPNGISSFVLVSPDGASYFDEETLKRNWAGPLHWKLSKKKTCINRERTNNTAIKEPFDFSIAPEINIRQLFSPAQSSQIQLSRESFILPKAKAKNLLPEDLCITSDDILSLMTKPGVIRCTKPIDTVMEQLQTELNPGLALMQNSNDDYGIDSNDDCDIGADDKENFDQPSNIDMIQPKFIPVETINYNKVSKQVDVHLLKEQLFGSIQKCSKKNKSVFFSDALKTMEHDYSNMCSLSICFISLLHLANEHQLVLSNNPHDYGDIVIQ